MDQIVADAGPVQARFLGPDVMSHRGGARREDGQVRPALALQLQLRALQAGADLVVADVQSVAGRRQGGVLESGDLCVPELLQLAWCRGVVPVTINDHERPARLG